MRRIPGPVSKSSEDMIPGEDNLPNRRRTSESLQSRNDRNSLVASALSLWLGLSPEELVGDLHDICRTHGIASIFDVQEGLHDLVVAGMIAVVEEVSVGYDGSVSLSLHDGTGCINGFLSSEEMAKLQQAFPHLALSIIPGNIIYLQRVAIYVARNPFQRLLSITHRSITAITEGERKRRTDSD